ncbi:unnamed protein product [Fraxinus pennsylvanica]|uniref:RNase H type-1 domain-containing protein n=1 Tax=Fraxinus pennsylvanica TaxID=56036 RepID=A0AAD1YUT4_9LAMI|nr:unnamed protein product [Fraxinus pennsylvanica]
MFWRYLTQDFKLEIIGLKTSWIWKAKFNCLSVDSRMRSTGVALASRCDCCDTRQVETLDNVLNSGNIAKIVWKWASLALGVHYLEAQLWWTRVNRWFTRAKKVSQRVILIGLLPSLITWKLWGRRCKARMEGNRESAEEVWFAIKAWLRLLVEDIVKVSKLSNTNHEFLKALELLVVSKLSKPTLFVSWRKATAGWVKLNVYGSSVGYLGPYGGGRVIRDHCGNLVASFCVKYRHGSNNEEELRTVIYGVELCKGMGFQRVEIECDLAVVVNWLTHSLCKIWYLWDYWDELLKLLSGISVTISHQYGEANRAADLLARQRVDGLTKRYMHLDQIPKLLRGIEMVTWFNEVSAVVLVELSATNKSLYVKKPDCLASGNTHSFPNINTSEDMLGLSSGHC